VCPRSTSMALCFWSLRAALVSMLSFVMRMHCTELWIWGCLRCKAFVLGRLTSRAYNIFSNVHIHACCCGNGHGGQLSELPAAGGPGAAVSSGCHVHAILFQSRGVESPIPCRQACLSNTMRVGTELPLGMCVTGAPVL
jgi:hypothetical protein